MLRKHFAYAFGYIGTCGHSYLCFAHDCDDPTTTLTSWPLHRSHSWFAERPIERLFASIQAFHLSFGGVNVDMHRSFSSHFRWIRLDEDVVLRRVVKGWMVVAFNSSCRSEPDCLSERDDWERT